MIVYLALFLSQALKILQSELLPVTTANGWRLSAFSQSVPIWRRTLPNHPIDVFDSMVKKDDDDESGVGGDRGSCQFADLFFCASYALCHAPTADVWDALKSLTKNLEWNPHLEYLQRYPQPNSDVALPHPAIG